MSNDRILLDETLLQIRTTRGDTRSDADFLELFVAEQILKDYDFSADEIESGLVGDGKDGGIDGMYLLANGELVQDDTDTSQFRREVSLELILIQTKSAKGFQETPIERFITASDDIFDLSKPLSNLVGVYNAALYVVIERFRNTYRELAARFPRLFVRYVYACKGDKPDTSVVRKSEKLCDLVNGYFSSVAVKVDFVGARDLLALARRAPTRTFSLALAENPVSSSGQVGFVGLAYLKDYYRFITDDNGQLRRQIFEANVRDYQGTTAVNEDIHQTLRGSGTEDFWWLNNGVTIVAARASLSAKELAIEDPQIVNGLQTSSEIFAHFAAANTSNEDRKLLVRVIVPTDSASRDRIIKATNSQTPVQAASLRATDKIHRDIEEFFKPRGLYYDRRKNFYRNEGKSTDAIIGIPHLGQAIMAVLLARPDQARARPSSLLKKDDDYRRVFSEDYPIELYFVVAKVMKLCEALLRTPELGIPLRQVNNLRFYVGMYAVYDALNKWRPSAREIASLKVESITREVIVRALVMVIGAYPDQGADDKIAKGPELVATLSKGFATRFVPPPAPK